MLLRSIVACVAFAAGLFSADRAGGAQGPQVLAPGYTSLQFQAPVPGSYPLPALWRATDGRVLDSTGRTVRLHELMGDKAVVMSFIYTHCNDANGCPLATFVLSQLQGPVRSDPALRDRVRLLTLSFDPARDTPDVMASYGSRFREANFDWRFLTCASEDDLAPILDSYDQSTQFTDGEDDVISHVLRVYLIGPDKQVRNIYNTSFLHADTVISDLRTVLAD